MNSTSLQRLKTGGCLVLQKATPSFVYCERREHSFQIHRGTSEAMCHHGTAPHVDYFPGTLNLILSAPHGGYICPPHIPDRDEEIQKKMSKEDKHCDRITTKPDKYTEELTEIMREEIQKNCGHPPHVIFCRLSRLKVDTNREQSIGTLGVPSAVKAWEDYHKSIKKAIGSMTGHSLLLDIHGHGHPEQRTELGYLICGSDLDSGNVNLQSSSIRSLVQRFSVSDSRLINGFQSFGGLLEAKGYAALPSPIFPTPARCRYHHGGFITKRYGSHNGGTTDAIQIESPRTFRQPDQLHSYAKALAYVTCKFMELYYTRES